MILRDYLPHQAVREFVQRYRICHFEFDHSRPVPIKVYPPKPEYVLYFFLNGHWSTQQPGKAEQLQSSITLAAQRTSIVKQFIGKGIFINVQIVFQPTAFFRLTGMPAYELTNQYLDATLIFHKDIQFTLEQLQQAKTYAEMLATVERFGFTLAARSRKDKLPLDLASRQMIHYSEKVSLDGLANAACLCARQFRRRFYERVGVNPNTYLRIIRFNKAFNLRNAYPEMDWLTIAIDCGYYDYQHLVKDYKEFTGVTPNAFHLLESQSPERILGLTDILYQERVRPSVDLL